MIQPYRQTIYLTLFLTLFLILYSFIAAVAQPMFSPAGLLVILWFVCFVVFLAGSYWIMRVKRLTGKWYWIQLAIILGGGCLFRILLVSRPVGLTRDIWRYLWDAHMIFHGYSPYIYTPDNPILMHLHTSFYNLVNYRSFPTRYPPLTELFFMIGSLITPTSPYGIKVLLVICDNITCLTLTLILLLKQIDARRVLLYAWCPLPIIEFALEGHVDSLAITWTVLAVLCTMGSEKRWRVLAGICLGFATLTKLYPILFLPALIRRRDWALLVSCGITIAIGYIPVLLLSSADPLSVFFASLGQASIFPNPLYLILYTLGKPMGIASSAIASSATASSPLFIISEVIGCSITGATIIFILIKRKRKQMSNESGLILILIVEFTTLIMYLPWYLAAFFPWLTVLSGSIHDQGPWSKKATIFILALSCLSLLCISAYIPFIGG